MEKLKEKVLQGAGQNSEALFLKMRERENRNMNIIVHNIKESNSRNKEYRIQNDRELLSNMTIFVKKIWFTRLNLVSTVSTRLNSSLFNLEMKRVNLDVRKNFFSIESC